MKKTILILNSITFAYKAKDYLYTKGIKAYVERISPSLRTHGCGYGVRVDGDVSKAILFLKEINLEVKEIIEV